MKNDKKGGAKVYVILTLLVVLVLAIAGMFIKLNWKRFKAEASYGFTITMLVIGLIVALILLIWILIKRAQRKKRKEQERLERERLEQERIAAGGQPSTLGNGKLEMSDVSEVAGKAIDRVDKYLEGGE